MAKQESPPKPEVEDEEFDEWYAFREIQIMSLNQRVLMVLRAFQGPKNIQHRLSW